MSRKLGSSGRSARWQALAEASKRLNREQVGTREELDARDREVLAEWLPLRTAANASRFKENS